MPAPEPIREVRWAVDAVDPIEVFEKSDLMQRFDAAEIADHERLEFHLVLIGRSSTGLHEVDFVETTMALRRVLHIEPGQVQRWRFEQPFDATLVLFPEAPAGLRPGWQLGVRAIDLEPERLREVDELLDLVRVEQARERRPASRAVVLRALRDLLFVRLGLDANRDVDGGGFPPAYVAFQRDLETHLSVSSSMEERARRTGYSARTISRSCQAVRGRTAKQVVDDRIVLEARRLLARPEASAQGVASVLGFSEQTNFAKYFRRHTGLTPTEWRRRTRTASTTGPG